MHNHTSQIFGLAVAFSLSFGCGNSYAQELHVQLENGVTLDYQLNEVVKITYPEDSMRIEFQDQTWIGFHFNEVVQFDHSLLTSDEDPADNILGDGSGVHPNPVNQGWITVTSNFNMVSSVALLDLKGQMVGRAELNAVQCTEGQVRIDLTRMLDRENSAGAYFLQIRSGSDLQTERIIIP